MKCYIFDIDGTLADLSHRLHFIKSDPKDWRSFFATVKDDAPIPHMVDLCRTLATHAPIVFISGRSDECRPATEAWLMEHVKTTGMLFMRKEGDHRPDHQVKVELLAELHSKDYEPKMAFDDRNAVVKMWRDLGVPCAQVAEGDF